MLKTIILLTLFLISNLFSKEYFISKKCINCNCTNDIQKIIDTKKYNTITFPKGEFLLNSLNLKSNTIFMAKNRGDTSLIFVKSKKKSFLNIDGESNITIKNFILKNYSNKSIITINGESNKTSDINILNNNILNYSKKDSIEIRFNANNINIIHNKMFYNTLLEAKKSWKQIAHIKYRGKVSNNKERYQLTIRENHIEGGNCGFRIVTKGLPLSNIIFEDNNLTNLNSAGIGFYHARNAIIKNNRFENITAVSMKNNDGGVVWLDRYRNGQIVFSDNIIENCKGNAIFVEELENSQIINNKIINIQKREKDKYKYSEGGNGILLTYLKSLEIKSNLFKNIENISIIIDSKLGVPHHKEVKKVYLKKNIFKNSKQLLKKDKKAKIYKDLSL